MMYWYITSPHQNVDSVISRERFEELRKYLHFVDNNTAPTGDGAEICLLKNYDCDRAV